MAPTKPLVKTSSRSKISLSSVTTETNEVAPKSALSSPAAFRSLSKGKSTATTTTSTTTVQATMHKPLHSRSLSCSTEASNISQHEEVRASSPFGPKTKNSEGIFSLI